MKNFFTVLFLVVILNLFSYIPACAEMVIYNTKTGKYHSQSCQWAKKCTVNCIKLDKKEAIKRGGVPCKVCRS